MEKLIITCAICGAEVTKEHNEAVPYTIDEIVEQAYGAYKAGASIIHLHVREDDGTPTQSAARFKQAIEAIKKKCPDVIVQPSTGGASYMTMEERLQPTTLNPEMATLDCGTLNFGGEEIFVNTEKDIIETAQLFKERGIKPELECFDKGHLDSLLRLNKKGIVSSPMHVSFVLGVNGGCSGEMRDFLYLVDSLPADATYSVAGIGRYEFTLATYAILHGGHVRVGLEDNIYLEKGVLTPSNADLVKKIVRIANEFGREIASPKQAREILGLREI